MLWWRLSDIRVYSLIFVCAVAGCLFVTLCCAPPLLHRLHTLCCVCQSASLAASNEDKKQLETKLAHDVDHLQRQWEAQAKLCELYKVGVGGCDCVAVAMGRSCVRPLLG